MCIRDRVYYLCLLLGYLGRYSISSKAELRSTMVHLDDKIPVSYTHLMSTGSLGSELPKNLVYSPCLLYTSYG